MLTVTLNISRTQHSHDPQPAPTVAHVQARLIGKGYPCGPYGADGIFGYASETATKRFQTHIGVVSDGIVGPITLRHLDDYIAPATVDAAAFADVAYRRVKGLDGAGVPRYVFGAEVANLADRHPMRLDCSELVQWAVYQRVTKTWIDGSWNQAAACRIISVDQAARTKGALLFVSGNGQPSGVHHVAISLGLGAANAHGTAEARSSTMGCGSWAIGSRFTFGGLIPIIHY